MSNVSQLDEQPESAHAFLTEAYRSLGFQDGTLVGAAKSVNSTTNYDDWLGKGDWLVLAEKVGVKSIFFVNNDPVVVFYEFQDVPSLEEQLDTFRRIWCMSRPQCLFMALPGELRVYSLNSSPAKNVKDWQKIEPLEVVRRAVDVATELRDYHREQIESGRLFADNRFGDIAERADRRLISDLKFVRQSLMKSGLNQEYTRHAHALIGRSIFIRYLEDRDILTPAYFEKVAENNPNWQKILSQKPEKPDLTLNLEKRRYDRVLHSKDFTYALFKKLAHDFNGDMFPQDEIEEVVVNQDHLDLIRGFLLGDVNLLQPSLFFWAYDFKIIPMELISSIYEEFYHGNNEDDKGTQYTPNVLVDFIVSQVLTEERLISNPRILDPACGSGIFLVESFRRIVRYKTQKQQKPLSSDELKQILRTQIVGIEINKEAAQVAAFSLYLALLNYLEPPDIMANKQLPNLIYKEDYPQEVNNYQILFNNNTFSLMDIEYEGLEGILTTSSRFKGRVQTKRLLESSTMLPLDTHSFDIIVGNPPWGFEEGTTREMREAQEQAQRWCEVFGWSIGDKELSQAFIARTLSLLKQGGVCGLLVSTGIFFKHQEKSQKFRHRWLEECTIKTVVNFVHVRHVFFNADAPFAFVQYEVGLPNPSHKIYYWSIKKTELIDKVQTIILSYSDLRQVKQNDIKYNETLWKVYWWGGHRDAALINTLNFNESLKQIAQTREWPTPGRGFQGFRQRAANYPSTWLKGYKELPIQFFHRYGLISDDVLKDVPEYVHRRGDRNIYSDWRLLVKRGITQAEGVDGQIEARLDYANYCFRNSIHGIRLVDTEEWERKVLIGILWSSLARYYFFMTASSWGTWHHEIHLEEVIKLPIKFTNNLELRKRIEVAVNKLQQWKPLSLNFESLTEQVEFVSLSSLEQELDEAIFDLYGLLDAERDLIRDMCKFGLDYFYNHIKSDAVKAVEYKCTSSLGVIDDLPMDRNLQNGLEAYIYTFLQVWNRELEDDGEFRWHIIYSNNAPMIAVVFTTQEKGYPLSNIPNVDEENEWQNVLKQCSEVLLRPVSKTIYTDSMVRAVTDTDILIVKRNEQRLWTRSAAREDAEATMLQAMYLPNEHVYEASK